MNLRQLVSWASDKTRFTDLNAYVEFCRCYLEFVARGIQAEIVAKNEPIYRFLQYKEDGYFNVTRPLNFGLMYDCPGFDAASVVFPGVLRGARDLRDDAQSEREIICRTVYTIQQAIGAALDALPAGKSNTARKVNGDLFERLIRLLVCALGIDCEAGCVRVPVVVDGVEQFKMNYQHDLIIKAKDEIKMIGSVKTSSKDRIDKVFIDKFLYSRLTDTTVPHVAIFLNDVQRKKASDPRAYGISATFLPGHFKGYTVKLNPLDGVYYCDIRPNMRTDSILQEHIRTIDHLFCRDLWVFLEQPGDRRAEVVEDSDRDGGTDD